MSDDSNSHKHSPCVSCLSMLIGVGALVIMIVGSVCLDSGDYGVCGGTRNGAVAMTAVGAVFVGLNFVVLALVCCCCCCAAGVALKVEHDEEKGTAK